MHEDGTEGSQGIPPSPWWIRARERPQEIRHPRIQIQNVHSTCRVGSTAVLDVLEERESPTAQLDRVCTVGQIKHHAVVLPVFPTHGIEPLFHERQLGVVEHDNYLAGTTIRDGVGLKLQKNRSQATARIALKQSSRKRRRV